METATQSPDAPAVEQTRGVVAIYDTMTAATEAVRKLGQAGVPPERLSIVTQNLESQTTVHGFVSMGDVATTGAGVGARFSLLAGAAFFLVPEWDPSWRSDRWSPRSSA